MEEIWKDIPVYKGLYQVSNKGGLRNLVTGKLLKASMGRDGYFRYNLSRNGRSESVLVHRLVLSTFDAITVNHMDGVKTNNNLENLEWVSRKENIHHSMRIGTRKIFGEGHGRHKLTAKQVLEIREKYGDRKTPVRIIAQEYGMSIPLINDILRGRRWKSIL